MGFSPCYYPRNPSGQETVAACVWFVPRERLRFRPEGSVSGSPVHKHVNSWVMTTLGGRGSCRAVGRWGVVYELVLGGPRGGARLGFGEPSGVALRDPWVSGCGECSAQQELRPPVMRPLGRARHYVRNPSVQGTVAACVWFVPSECLRFRPEGSVSGSPGRSPGFGAPPNIGFET